PETRVRFWLTDYAASGGSSAPRTPRRESWSCRFCFTASTSDWRNHRSPFDLRTPGNSPRAYIRRIVVSDFLSCWAAWLTVRRYSSTSIGNMPGNLRRWSTAEKRVDERAALQGGERWRICHYFAECLSYGCASR